MSWNVMRAPIEASEKQVAKFKKLFHHNARPVQPLNGRKVKVSRK